MLDLLQVTLCCLTGKDYKAHQEALDYSCERIKFGEVKLIKMKSKTIDEWNYNIIYKLTDYIDTPYALLIHADGFVVNPFQWNAEWLNYDYIGAPWPLPKDDYSYRTPEGKLVRVGNSVSLRSKKILELPRKLGLEWRSYYGNTNEDGYLCVHNRTILEENSCVFAPLEVAKHFSRETSLPENEGIEPFVFHRYEGENRYYPRFLKRKKYP